MQIEKVLNNNVVVTKDQFGREIIASGKGIGFQKKVGDTICETAIDKQYILENHNDFLQLQQLFSQVDIQYIELSDEIKKCANETLEQPVNDRVIIGLADHIAYACERAQKGIYIPNMMLWDIRKFYKQEFEVGKKALELIKQKIDIQLTDDEAGFIALHLVEAQLDSERLVITEVTNIMNEILSIVKRYYQFELDENSLHYFRFVTHLKFFAQRLLTDSGYKESDNELFELIIRKYRAVQPCIEMIKNFIQSKYQYILSEEEQIYLTIHIARIVDEMKKTK